MEKTIRWFCVGFLAGAVCWCLDSAPGLRNLDGGRDAVAQVDAGASDCAPCFAVHRTTVETSPFEFRVPDYDHDNPPAVLLYFNVPDGSGRLVWRPWDFALTPDGDLHSEVSPDELGAGVRILVFR